MYNQQEINIHDIPRYRSLLPEVQGQRLESALGFSYVNLRCPIKFLRFDDGEFSRLMEMDVPDAMTHYTHIRDLTQPKYIANFIYAILFLMWERALLDESYRDDILALGNVTRLRSYSFRRGAKIPDNLDRYYCSNLLKVRAALAKKQTLTMFNKRGPHELFGDIPTFNEDRWDEHYEHLLSLMEAL